MRIKLRHIFIWMSVIMIAAGAAYAMLPYGFLYSKNFDRIKADTIPRLAAALEEKELEIGNPIFIRIFKESKELELWVRKDHHYQLFKTYPICNYSGTLGPKLKEGDLQSPEGFYFVKKEQMNPNSQFHLSFNLGFPNKYDRANKRTGSYLMVHGNCVSIGCYAMTDDGIEEIYLMAHEALKNGQPFFRVHIFPFRMTQHHIAKMHNSPWHAFWQNLQLGYDYFETHKIPPDIHVRDKKYIIRPSDPIEQ